MTQSSDLEPEVVKACCATVYASDWVRLLLGDSFHPGGLVLTTRLAELLGLNPMTTVLDVAAGRGASAIHLAQTFGCRVIGVECSGENVAAARSAARAGSVEHLVSFREGDAEALPVVDGSVDAVICECAFCTFPDKPTAARELARVLRPGGRLGLADLTRQDELPAELSGLLAWFACLGDARPAEEYVAYLGAAGFEVPTVERHDEALLKMARQVRRRLTAAELIARFGQAPQLLGDLAEALRLAEAAETAISAGQLGYALLIATRRVEAHTGPSARRNKHIT